MYSQLYNLIDKLNRNPQDGKLVSEAEEILKNLSSGISVPPLLREKLYNTLMCLGYSTKGRLKELSREVLGKIREERQNEATAFYMGHLAERTEDSEDKKIHIVKTELNGINFDREIYRKTIESGTTLYQWCKMKVEAGAADILIGSYFSDSIVSPETLGLGGLFELCDENDKFVGIAERVCCSFTFPFTVKDCLVSTAKGTVDNWSVKHNNWGRKIRTRKNEINERVPTRGLWGRGGARQYYIPLTKEQKKTLAKIAKHE